MTARPDPANSPFDTTSPERYRASRRVALVSMGANLVLSIGQIIIGLVGHSYALVADAFHTLADLSTDIVVFFALKQSSKEADEEHPYGHARIETAVTVGLGIVLVLVGVGIALRAGARIFSDEPFVLPEMITLWAAGTTVLAKEALYHYTLATARRYGSDLLRASAWHHRSDAISSVLVFAGIGGSVLGLTYMDAVAAITVAVFVIKVGIELGWPGVAELVDTGLAKDQLDHIRRSILDVDGVKALHFLRTRQLGGRALVDVHIIVDERISVSEGHQISEAVRRRLIHEIDVVSDVLVHIDPEDDAAEVPSAHLPSRVEVSEQMRAALRAARLPASWRCLQLHYLAGAVHVDLVFGADAPGAGSTQDHAAQVVAALRGVGHLGSVRVWYE